MIELFVVLAVTTAVIGLAGSLPDRRKVKRLLGTARVQPINSLKDGAAAVIRGEVVASDLVEAPVSKRPCAYWLVIFDEVGTGGDYRELGRADESRTFVLRDDTGDARIAASNAHVAVAPLEATRSFFDGPGGKLAALYANCKRPNYPALSTLRITEYAVLPGAKVTVLGVCTFETNPDATKDVTGYRAALPTRPVVSGSRRRPLLIG
jgi:hypothetical protein